MIVGIAQIGALIPGVSRSGSTLTAALALGLKRDEAARFSFLACRQSPWLASRKRWELHKVQLSADGGRHPSCRARRGFYFRVLCDLGADARSRAFFRLAVCYLPRCSRYRTHLGGCFGLFHLRCKISETCMSEKQQEEGEIELDASNAAERRTLSGFLP